MDGDECFQCLVAGVLVVLANALHAPATIFGPYLGASALVLSFALANHVFHTRTYGVWAHAAAIATTALLGCAWVVAPVWIAGEDVRARAPTAIAMLVLFATYFDTAVEIRRSGRILRPWTLQRTVLTLAVAGGVLGLQATGVMPPWNPE